MACIIYCNCKTILTESANHFRKKLFLRWQRDDNLVRAHDAQMATHQFVGEIGIDAARIQQRDIALQFRLAPQQFGVAIRYLFAFGANILEGQQTGVAEQGMAAEITGDKKAHGRKGRPRDQIKAGNALHPATDARNPHPVKGATTRRRMHVAEGNRRHPPFRAP